MSALATMADLLLDPDGTGAADYVLVVYEKDTPDPGSSHVSNLEPAAALALLAKHTVQRISPPKRCATCGGAFVPRRVYARYCSATCRRGAYSSGRRAR